MSMGGDFYSMTDEQLEKLLNEEVDYFKFLNSDVDPKPRECFSKAEIIWFDLTKLLAEESACGSEMTDVIPEMSGYSYAEEVKSIAHSLIALSEDELKERYAADDFENSFDEIYPLIIQLIEFYQRAAQHGDAVLFRVT